MCVCKYVIYYRCRLLEKCLNLAVENVWVPCIILPNFECYKCAQSSYNENSSH